MLNPVLSKENVIQSLFQVVDDINTQLPPKEAIRKSSETPLFGAGATLTSIGLVTFIVAVEQKLEEDFQVTVSLASDRAMSQKNSPFRQLDTLADFILEISREGNV